MSKGVKIRTFLIMTAAISIAFLTWEAMTLEPSSSVVIGCETDQDLEPWLRKSPEEFAGVRLTRLDTYIWIATIKGLDQPSRKRKLDQVITLLDQEARNQHRAMLARHPDAGAMEYGPPITDARRFEGSTGCLQLRWELLQFRLRSGFMNFLRLGSF